MGSYDDKLLEYYLGKSVSVLNRTHNKYKCYAEKLSEKCESIRKQIDNLYGDLKVSKRLHTNAFVASRVITKERRRFIRSKGETLPWCPDSAEPDDYDLNDVDAELANQSVRAELIAELQKLQEISAWLAPMWKSVVDGQGLESAVRLLDETTDIDGIIADVNVTHDVSIPALKKEELACRGLVLKAEVQWDALEYFMEQKDAHTFETLRPADHEQIEKLKKKLLPLKIDSL
jgi:hypothetical protein